MILFMVAITEPALPAKYEKDEARPEQIVLPPTSLLANNIESAKTQAVVKATIETKGLVKTDPTRWEVHARPF